MTAPGKDLEPRKYPSSTKAGNVVVPAELAAAWAFMVDDTASLVMSIVQSERRRGRMRDESFAKWTERLEQLADMSHWLSLYAMYAQMEAGAVRDQPAVERGEVAPVQERPNRWGV